VSTPLRRITILNQGQATVFGALQQLSVQTLDLKPVKAADTEVAAGGAASAPALSGLLWRASMPPWRGLGSALVSNHETVSAAVGADDLVMQPVGESVFVSGSHSFWCMRNILGSAASRPMVVCAQVPLSWARSQCCQRSPQPAARCCSLAACASLSSLPNRSRVAA